MVAPFTGAWIEIGDATDYEGFGCVAPFTGAWIEIYTLFYHKTYKMSLPSRGRGLKFLLSSLICKQNRRSLHGGVD